MDCIAGANRSERMFGLEPFKGKVLADASILQLISFYGYLCCLWRIWRPLLYLSLPPLFPPADCGVGFAK
jgi:hypothetical protein